MKILVTGALGFYFFLYLLVWKNIKEIAQSVVN